MKITVVVRTYKRPDFLREALASIQSQTHTDWEVLIFDDAGLPKNFEIYKKFKESNPNNRVVYLTSTTPHEMYKDSWKLGLKLSKGELFVRLDDDDLFLNDTLEYLSNIYEQHPTLDFSYGSSIFFGEEGLRDIIQTQTPFEPPKTRDTWTAYTIPNNHPWTHPWSFTHDYYDEPQHYTSIIHCSKANHMCSFHTYAIRIKSALRVVNEFDIVSNFVDDLEMMGSLEYLGLTHTSIKRILTYVRVHDTGRLTDSSTKIGGRNLFEDILHIRDKVEYLRTEDFKTSIYQTPIDGNFNEGYVSSSHQTYFKEYKHRIEEIAKTFV